MSSSITEKEQEMKDKYGYTVISQKNYDPKFKMGTEVSARRVEREGEEPHVEVNIKIWAFKGKNEKLYTECGGITLKGEELAEFAELFKN